MPHVDPIGSIILPGALMLLRTGFLFGYAKPVPVRFDRLRNPRRDGALVGVAGPASNLLLALVAALVLRAVATSAHGPLDAWAVAVARMAYLFVTTNVWLALFNLLPIPPADGSRVVEWILPPRLSEAYSSIGRYGMVLMLVLASTRMIGPLLSAPYGAALGVLERVAGIPL